MFMKGKGCSKILKSYLVGGQKMKEAQEQIPAFLVYQSI